MTDYAEVTGSNNTTGFYPVPAGIDPTSAATLLMGDLSAASKIIAGLPDPGPGMEWYVVSNTEGVVTAEDDNFIVTGNTVVGPWTYV